MRGSCRTLIGLEASGIRAFRDSLKKNQHRVCGVVWHAGQGRPADTVILTLPWGWNMVRCGAVSHPSQWQWLGYHEIMGQRQRYRLLDLDRLCWRLRAADLDQVRKNLAVSLAERIARAR